MKFETIPPPADLEEIVRFFWVYESNDAGADYVYRSLADGCAELIFTYQGVFQEMIGDKKDTSPLCHLVAPTRHYRRFFTNDSFGIFGVYLLPFSLPLIFHSTTDSFNGDLHDTQSLAGRSGRILDERILTAKSNAERVEILSAFLRDRISKSRELHPVGKWAISKMIQTQGQIGMQSLLSDACISQRQLERKVKELTGFTPKTYSRILRFQAATAQYSAFNTASLTEIGLQCGYYDQSHFIHDFKEFSGYQPGEYFSGNGEGMEYRDA